MKRVLTIAGSDCSGGAGIQADIKTISALGCYGMSVVTAITAQNSLGVTRVDAVDPDMVTAQIKAILDDMSPHAVKTGMLHSVDAVKAVVKCMRTHALPHVVVDPVMMSTSGSRLLSEDAVAEMVGTLFPLADLVTPNVAEAYELTDSLDPEVQASRILDLGPAAVLLKGGDRDGDQKTDLLFMADGTRAEFSAPAVETVNTHGTGCTFSSAIASCLAQGRPLIESVSTAKAYVTAALISGAQFSIGSGHGPLDHFYSLRMRHE